jgi:hypothetical protein
MLSILNFPELGNNFTLMIELIAGIIIAILISVYFHRKQAALSKNQDSILKEVNTLVSKINELTLEQSKLINIMEMRRRNRIRWFKHHSLTVLNSVKKRYQELSDAVDKYVLEENEENRRRIEVIAKGALKLTVPHAVDLITNRDLQIAAEYIESTWIIAKLPDTLMLIGDGFERAKHSPEDILNIKESIKLSVKSLDYAIDQINNERD